MIDKRSEIVEKRLRIWDWEWDKVIWRLWGKEVILTNVKRKTGYLFARKMHDKSWKPVLGGAIKLFKNTPKYKQRTILMIMGENSPIIELLSIMT